MAKTPVRTRKRVKKQVADGMAHIHASFNNTIVTLREIDQCVRFFLRLQLS
jgi:small subunit ribosomal protein S11